MLRVALVGCGLISEAHLRAYLAHADRAKIVVCCDPDREKAERRAAQADGARVEMDFDRVLSDPEVDSVDLLTPHHLHRDQTIAALRAGKHVLLQKPLAKDLAECDDILAAARDSDRVLFYGEHQHTAPAVVAARQAIDKGRIGALIGTQATYAHWQGGDYLKTSWRYDPAVAGGGQLLDGGIHHIASMVAIGGPIESVAAFVTRFRPELGGEDTAALTFRYESGALGAFFSSHASGVWIPGASFVAFGTEGLLALGGPHGALSLHRRGAPEPEVLIADHPDGFVAMIGRYLDVVLDGAPSLSTAEMGRHELQVVLAAYRSAQTEQAVRVV